MSRHGLGVSIDPKLFPVDSFHLAVLFWNWENFPVWAQPIQLTLVPEACLSYLSRYLVIHPYLDWCLIQKSKFYLNFFCSFSNETVCPGDWTWRNYMLLLERGLSELESSFQKFPLNIIFTVYQIEFCARLKLVRHRSILERKFHAFINISNVRNFPCTWKVCVK